MRIIQALIIVLHLLTICRCLDIAGALLKEVREGANGIRLALVVMFTGLVGRSLWSIVAVLNWSLSSVMLIWHVVNITVVWVSLFLLEKEMSDEDKEIS